jgi:hypothetical protein
VTRSSIGPKVEKTERTRWSDFAKDEGKIDFNEKKDSSAMNFCPNNKEDEVMDFFIFLDGVMDRCF